MTIAAIYLTAEGVIFGADSTSTYRDSLGKRYYNHAQKLFEIGQDSSLAAVTWGLAGLNVSSYRTLFALLNDSFKHKKPKTLQDVLKYWSTQFWQAYSTSPYLKDVFDRVKLLAAMSPYDPSTAIALPNSRSKTEEVELANITNEAAVGFCIGGYVLPDRTPSAFSILFDPSMSGPPAATELKIGWTFYGAPNIVQRLQFGHEASLRQKVLDSGLWTGTPDQLDAILGTYTLDVPTLPVRDALDFVYTNILATTKTLKFSSVEVICGGPIELGVITSDRSFRWVRHKEWSSAIAEGNGHV